MHILFICTGNVCRSAIAERVTRAFALEKGISDLTVESAGTRALVGFPMEPKAAAVVTGLGGRPDRFSARKLKASMIKSADLVLTMTESQLDDAEKLVPGIRHCAFTLLEAARVADISDARTVADLAVARRQLPPGERENIADPVGLSETAFAEVGDTIAAAVLGVLELLHRAEVPVPAPVVLESVTEPMDVVPPLPTSSQMTAPTSLPISQPLPSGRVLVFRRPAYRPARPSLAG